MTDEGRPVRPKQLERELRQSLVGLTKWSGETAMEPVFLLAREGNYRAATEALMQMVADRTVVLHRWYEHVLLRAAIAYGVDSAPLRDAQTLPDWPVLEDFGFLLDHVIDWLEDRLPDGEAERMRETHRCGEGGMVVSWLATCIAESNIELTRAEQQAIQMLRYEADTDWFKYRVSTYTPPPRTNYAVAPGAYLQEWIDEQGISVQQAVALLGCSSKQLDEIISGQTPVTDTIAHHLEQLVGIPAESWLRYESTYRADIARLAREENQEGTHRRSYGTSGGIELTDDLVEKLADEAEEGYPTEQLRYRKAERFNQSADVLIRRVMPEIPEEYRAGFESMMTGGEYAMAIDDLAALVADHHIQLSAADTKVLRELTTGQYGEVPPTSLSNGSGSTNPRKDREMKELPDRDTCRRVAQVIADKDPALALRLQADQLHVADLALIERYASAVVEVPRRGWGDTDGSANRFWTALAQGIADVLSQPNVARYRTRPMEIDAIQVTRENEDEVKSFAGDALIIGDGDQPRLRVHPSYTPYVQLGDWIAKTEHGFRVLRADEVDRWLEPVEGE